MERIDLQGLFEHVEGALPLAQLLAHHTEAVIDAHHVALALGVFVTDQDGLVDLAGLVPVLHLVEQIGAADQSRQIGRVDVVGALVELQRLFVILQSIGATRGAIVEIVELVGLALLLLGLTGQHVENRRQGMPLLVFEVEHRQRLGRLHVLGVQGHHRGQEFLGLGAIAEAIEIDPGGVVQKPYLVENILGECLGPAHHLSGLEPIAARRIQLDQVLHGRHVRLLNAERLQEVGFGLLRVVEVQGLDAADAVVELDLLLRVVGVLHQLGHEVDGHVPLGDALVEPTQGVERPRLGAIESQNVLVSLDRAIWIAQLMLVDLAHRAVQIDARGGLVGHPNVVLVGGDQRIPFFVLAIESGQLAISGVIALVGEEDFLQTVGSPVELSEALLPRRRHALVKGDPLGVSGATHRAGPRESRDTARPDRSSRRAARAPVARADCSDRW